MRGTVIAFALGSLVSGCAVKVADPSVEWVIFPAERAAWSMDALSEGRWTPSSGQVSEALAQVPEFLTVSEPTLAERLHEYRCQCFGIVVEKRKRICCNFFRAAHLPVEWRTEPVIVKDGGSNYFQLHYDIDSGECLDLSINGEA